MKKTLLLLSFILVLWASLSWGATYYMRSDGTAANKAAATGPCGTVGNAINVTVHNGETFAAGDTITVCDDEGTYKPTEWVIPSSGSAGNVITYIASGSPLIDPTTQITGFELHSGSIWVKTDGSWIIQMWEDGTRMTWIAAHDDLVAGSYAQESDQLYVRASDDGNPNTGHVIEHGTANPIAIKLNGQSHLVFDGISVTKAEAASYNTDVTGSHDILIKNCTVSYCGIRSILIGVTTANADMDASDITIQNVVSHNDLDVGFWVGYGTRLIVENSTVYNQGADVSPNGKLYPIAGDRIHYPNGIVVRNCTDCIVRHNYVHDTYGCPILDEYVTEDGGGNNLIFANHIVDNVDILYQSAIKIEGEDTTVSCNLIESPYNWGIHTNHTPGNPHILNNTIISAAADNSVWFQTGANITFKNNIVFRSGSTNRYVTVHPDADTGIDMSNNLYYGSSTGRWMWDGSEYTSLATWQAASSQDAGALNEDPLFVSATDFHLQAASPCISGATGINCGAYAMSILEGSKGSATLGSGGTATVR